MVRVRFRVMASGSRFSRVIVSRIRFRVGRVRFSGPSE